MQLSDPTPSDFPSLDDPSLADLAQVLAHRLRSPLTSIQCYTDLLADRLGTAEERDMALRIFEGVAAIEDVLADLQRFSVALTPVLRPLDACRLTKDVIDGLGEGARVTLDAPPSAPVEADPQLLRQALLILLRNALDAVPVSTVRLAIELDADGCSPSASTVQFEVWNAGALPDAERAFAPFFTTKSQNLGLGLSMARRIAVAHGGSLCVAASDPEAPDAGVTFTLLLPAGGNDDETKHKGDGK